MMVVNKQIKQQVRKRSKQKDKQKGEWTKLSTPLHCSKLKNNFQFWWVQFQLCVTVKKFEEAVREKSDPNMPASKTANHLEGETGKKERLAVARTSLAMANLTLALSDPDNVAALCDACTEEWPEVLVHLVIKELKETHELDDLVTDSD